MLGEILRTPFEAAIPLICCFITLCSFCINVVIMFCFLLAFFVSFTSELFLIFFVILLDSFPSFSLLILSYSCLKYTLIAAETEI